MSISCWGCGQDWKHRWEAKDLAFAKVDDGGVINICPDCIEEIGVENINFDVDKPTKS